MLAQILVGCSADSGKRPRVVVQAPKHGSGQPPPPGPAILDTIRPYTFDRPQDFGSWIAGRASLPRDVDLQWRMPAEWVSDSPGRARSADGLVRLQVIETDIAEQDLSLADYLGELSQGEPVTSYLDRTRFAVYVTSREVSVAPTDPNTPRSMFHTAIVDVDDRYVKVEITFDSVDAWRFNDLAHAMLGTIQITPREPTDS